MKPKIFIFMFMIVFLFCLVKSDEFLFTSPDQNINLGSVQASTIQIADDESMVVVGYSNGLVQSYSLGGVLLGNFSGFSAQIYEIEWIKGVGPMVFDINGNVKIYKPNGSVVLASAISSIDTSSLIGTTDLTSLKGNFYISFIYPSVVNEYVFNSTSNNFYNSRNYTSSFSNVSIYGASYSTGYEVFFLFAMNNLPVNESIFNIYTGYYNCSTGKFVCKKGQMISNVTFPVPNQNIAASANIYSYGQSYILALAINTNPNSFNALFQFNNTYFNTNQLAPVMVVCPSTLYFAIGPSELPAINIFDVNNNFIQQVSHLINGTKSIGCSQHYLVSLDTSNYLAFFTYVPNPSDKLQLGVVGIISVSVLALILLIALITTVFYCVSKRKKRHLLLDDSPHNSQAKQAKTSINRLKSIAFISWETTYLLIFTASNVLNLVWSSNIGSILEALIPLILVTIALLIKLVLMWRKVTLKTFFQMQLDFISPYVLTAINMILTFQIGVSFNYNAQSREFFENFQPDLPTYFVLEGVQYSLVTVLCSLIMNKKSTSKTQFYFFVLNIVLQAVGSLLMTIFYIQNLNEASDKLKDAINVALQNSLSGQFATVIYDSIFQELSVDLSAFDSAKDYALASLASIIAVLIILLDMIGRPFEKQEQHQEILEDFLKSSHKNVEVQPHQSDSTEIQLLKKQHMQLFALVMQSEKHLKMKIAEQNARKDSKSRTSVIKTSLKDPFELRVIQNQSNELTSAQRALNNHQN